MPQFTLASATKDLTGLNAQVGNHFTERGARDAQTNLRGFSMLIEVLDVTWLREVVAFY